MGLELQLDKMAIIPNGNQTKWVQPKWDEPKWQLDQVVIRPSWFRPNDNYKKGWPKWDQPKWQLDKVTI